MSNRKRVRRNLTDEQLTTLPPEVLETKFAEGMANVAKELGITSPQKTRVLGKKNQFVAFGPEWETVIRAVAGKIAENSKGSKEIE